MTTAWFTVLFIAALPGFPEDDSAALIGPHFATEARCEAFIAANEALMAEEAASSGWRHPLAEHLCVEMPVLPEDG